MIHTTCALDVQLGMDSDDFSDVTLDELQSPYLFGEPLKRMVEFEYFETPSLRHTDFDDFSECSGSFAPATEPAEQFVRDEEINYIEDVPLDLPLRKDGEEGGDYPLSTVDSEYVRRVVDHMAANPPLLPSSKVVLQSLPNHPSHPLLVRRITSDVTSARERALWRYMNNITTRRDPWNPSPPAQIVEHELHTSSIDVCSHVAQLGDDVQTDTYIVMDRLRSLRDNPLQNADDVIDFSRQMLQALVFLHEHNIAQASYSLSEESGFESIMMDIGLAPPHAPFSRYDFPVKYYILDFTRAIRLQVQPSTTSPSRTGLPLGTRQDAVRHPPVAHAREMPHRAAPHTRSLFTDSSLNVMVTLSKTCRGRACSVPDITLVPPEPAYITSPDCAYEFGTPKRSRFFTRPSSPQELSDPEDPDEGSERDEEDGVRVVCAATRNLLLAADLKHVADTLEEAAATVPSIGEALVPIITAMRQARALSLSAEDALRMFERASRSFVWASAK